MENISSAEAFFAMTMAELKERSLTNAPLDVSSFKGAIEESRLYCVKSEAGLLAAEDRMSHAAVSFWLHRDADGAVLAQNAEELSSFFNKPLVLEFAMKEHDERAETAVRMLENSGFCAVLRRMKMSAEVSCAAEKTLYEALPAKPSDLHEICGLFSSSYDMLTGCLPTEGELSGSIQRGEVFCVRTEGTVAGALEIRKSRTSEEIRHIAVRPEMKRRGVASGLILSRLAASKMTLWVNENNEAAKSLYESLGFKYTGHLSVVMIKNIN